MLNILLGAVELGSAVEADLADAVGRVLAVDVASKIDVPPFDNSAMDGYAIRRCDVSDSGCRLRVVATSAAGRPVSRGLGPNEAVRILTGAAMVAGADTVVPVEATDGGTNRVTVFEPPKSGAHIRRAGEDIVTGDLVVEADTRLNPSHIGLLASVGRSTVTVRANPRVAVVSTGDELVAPPKPLGPGEIYQSNGLSLASALRCCLGSEASISVHQFGDDAHALLRGLEDLAADSDLIVTSGGVSMGGEYDTVKSALAPVGFEFWRIAMRPAKPMGFGRIGRCIVIALAGNPVAAQVAFEVFVRPVLRRFVGLEPAVVPDRQMIAGERFARRADGKTHYLRVRFGDGDRVYHSGGQGSHVQSAMAAADGLCKLGPDVLSVEAGDVVSVVELVGR